MWVFDLKEFRQNRLKMTQEEFATLIDERQDTISRMEKNPETISLMVLQKIANAVGSTLDQLVGFQKSNLDPLDVEDTWENLQFAKKTIIEYILKKLNNNEDKLKQEYNEMIEELKSMINLSINKPKIAIVGMSDAGKSRLINSLLGIDKMPTSWTPTTAISVHLKHIEDRPAFIEDEVWILKSELNKEVGWDVTRFEDEDYCKQWKLAGGSIEILSKYGVRQEEEYNEAGSAIVFINSPILKVCDLVDLPGFGTGDREIDDILAEKAKNYADIIIYMSIANGFLRGTDIEFLKSTLNNLPVIESKDNELEPLSNLFIVASQAHVVDKGNKIELDKILNAGCSRLYKQIPEEVWENKNQISRLEYNETTLRNRFFTYTTDIDSLRNQFETNLKTFIEKFPPILFNNVKLSIKEFVEDNKLSLDKDIEQYYEIINEREKYIKILNQTRENEPIRINESKQLRLNVVDKIRDFHTETTKDFNKEYDSILTVDNIVSIIETKDYKKKKEDMELLAGFISSKLQARLQNILKNKSEELNGIIDKYIEDFNAVINNPIDIELQGVKSPFNAKRAFASGLAGVATFGALAVWASTLGNLGAYILVAKGVSILSALGISVAGGTAGAASLVAAIGGPVVLGVALAIINAFAVYSLFSGGWKKSVAKKMIKEYEKENAIGKFNEVIDGFWSDTEIAFNAAADSLEEKYQKYIQELEKIVTIYNIEDLENYINQAKNMKNFLDELPL